MLNEPDKKHIGYAILESGCRYSMKEKFWSVFTVNRGWIWSSDLAVGDIVHSIACPELDDEVVGFSFIEEVMNS
jgi:hypothetical protein